MTAAASNPPGMSLNASGMDSAITNIAAITSRNVGRVRPASARITLPSHAYPTHGHQTRPSTTSPWASPTRLTSVAISAVTWVME